MIMRIPALRRVRKVKDDEGHEHDNLGRFTSGGGGSAAAKKPKSGKTKRKMERREQAARDTTGAIQTLLTVAARSIRSGGSKHRRSQKLNLRQSQRQTPRRSRPEGSGCHTGSIRKANPMVALQTIDRRAGYWNISQDAVERTHIRAAAAGIAYALETGRLHDRADVAVQQLSSGDIARLVEEMASKELIQADIPRYLNDKYPAEQKPAQT